MKGEIESIEKTVTVPWLGKAMDDVEYAAFPAFPVVPSLPFPFPEPSDKSIDNKSLQGLLTGTIDSRGRCWGRFLKHPTCKCSTLGNESTEKTMKERTRVVSADIKIGNDVTMEYVVSDKMMKFEVMTYLPFWSMVTGRIKLTDSPFSKQNFAR